MHMIGLGLKSCVYICIATVFVWLVSYTSWNLVGSEWLGAAYDSLGKNLLAGNASLDKSAIIWEGFHRDGKSYMCFGPFPAMVRIVLNFFYPENAGQWSRISCLFAALGSVLAFGSLLSRALAQNTSISERAKVSLWCLCLFGFALGTPLAYLISCSRIYHEAILWGLCGGMWGLVAIIKMAQERILSNRSLILFSCSFFVALLSRVTFGIPMVLILPVLLFYQLPNRRDLLRRLYGLTPALCAIAIQLWYNYERFRSIFILFDYNLFYFKPSDIGGEFNVARIPDTLWHYFGLSWRYIISAEPFFIMPTTNAQRPDLFMQGWREQTIPLSLASTWLIVCGIVGLGYLRCSRWRLLSFYAPCVLAEASIILVFYFITQRYSAEFLPLLSLGFFGFLANATLSAPKRVTLGILCLASVGITVMSTLEWNMTHNIHCPSAYKDKLIGWFKNDPEPDPAGRVYLSDLKPLTEEFTFTRTKMDVSTSGSKLRTEDQHYKKGLGMQAAAKLTYLVPEGSKTLFAIISIPIEIEYCLKTSVKFSVIDELGKAIFASAIFSNPSVPTPIRIDVSGTKTVTLVVDDAGDGKACDHANWNLAAFDR